MMSCEIMSGGKRTALIGVYLPLSPLGHLPDLNESLNRLPGRDSIIIRDLNAVIRRLQNLQNQQVTYLLEYFVLANIFSNFRQ